MSSQVSVLGSHEVVITNEQTDLIKRTICQGATDAEMKLFFFDCQRRGTHPLDKLIHFTKRSGKYTPITSIDFFRLRAHGSGVYAGEDEPVFTTITSGAPDTCKYTVYRLVNGTRCPWTATARWEEYYPGDSLGFMWKKMPFLMLAKCAEALALRKAFPAELQGLYVKEEMDQAGPVHRVETRQECTGHGHETLESLAQCQAQQAKEAPAPSVFEESSAIADHEINLDASHTSEELQKAWDDVVRDKRLTSDTRKPLYDRMKKIAAGLGKKK